MDADTAALAKYGCVHYKRKCKIRAPCCGEVFDCRHCHNEAKDSLEFDTHDRHVVPRHEIKLVICSLCNKEQDVQQHCSSCGTCFGKYFCAKCNFFDDDVSKNQFHCDGCGICRTGGAENFYHCAKCGCCYTYQLKDSHRCVDGAMHHNCPVCFEINHPDLNQSLSRAHTVSIRLDESCQRAALWTHDSSAVPVRDESASAVSPHSTSDWDLPDAFPKPALPSNAILLRRQHADFPRFSCPVCLRSACDMSDVWRKLDREVAASPMPAICQKKMIWILCNDCGMTSKVQFHILAHKCPGCSSYNTRQTRSGPAACSRV